MQNKEKGAEALKSISTLMSMSHDDISRLTGDDLKSAVQGLMRKVWSMQKEQVKLKRKVEAKSTIIEHQQSAQRRMIAEVIDQIKGAR